VRPRAWIMAKAKKRAAARKKSSKRGKASVNVSHPVRERFLNHADCAPQRIGLVFAKGRHFWQRGAGDQDCAVIVRCELDPIADHCFSPRSLRIST
jgi:hypothetical protein